MAPRLIILIKKTVLKLHEGLKDYSDIKFGAGKVVDFEETKI